MNSEKNMPSFEDALALAARAHKGQYDLAGAPYICHPMRVALAQTDERARIVAILHDVVEDTPITYDDLAQAGFNADIIAAVEALTKRPGEKRIDAAVRAKANPLALQVKLADVADNMNLARIGHPTVEDYARLREYEGVLAYLKQE